MLKNYVRVCVMYWVDVNEISAVVVRPASAWEELAGTSMEQEDDELSGYESYGCYTYNLAFFTCSARVMHLVLLCTIFFRCSALTPTYYTWK